MEHPSRDDIEAYRAYLFEQERNDKWIKFDLCLLAVLVVAIIAVNVWL